ncbi:OmpA family protein [Lewinella sp. IMCC34183]|uniref:OmpA family protein n=1 Tax=Lewinella sp. IMCC34183 TaxID=2248762 RepID=UPI0018E5A964|nr:OmpA family protein [Lewinella sp. IMCC34183]
MARPLFGQAPARDRAVSAFDRGVQQLLDGSPRRAVRFFEAAVDHDNDFLPARRLLGVARDLAGDPAGALSAYHEVLRRDSNYSRLLYYQVGDVYLRNGEPRTALEWFERFRALQARDRGDFGLPGEQEAGTEAFVLEHELRQRILSAQITSDSLNYVHASELERLGPEINGPLNEYFPFFTNDGTGVLFTRQSADGDEDLITGRRRRAGATFTTSRFGTFNTQQPEGMCTLVRDGETIFFTLCHEVASGGSCDLHAGVLIDGRIERIAKLPDHLNSATWDSQAAISCDGRQLLFASTRPGGVGGSDLYACRRLPDGGWSEPVNLGAGVNSPGDEEAPFLSNDGETLYFSSTGHGGLGDQDIYFSRRDPTSGRWTPAVNIGPPINGPSRELGFHLTPDGRTGYFASDRAGGAGGLDIYRFRLGASLTGREVTYVSGYVTDSLTGAPVADQAVPLASGDVFRTNYAGRFFICAPPGQGLPLTVDRAGYAPYRRTFDVPRWDNRSPYRIDLRLRRPAGPAAPPPPPPAETTVREEEVVLDMLFGFEQATPLRGELDDLDRFLGGIDLDRIAAVIVLGYTDETGGDAFNRHLSQRRADAVAELLRAAGIPADRITTEGRGETKAAADRRQNRKVSIHVRLR